MKSWIFVLGVALCGSACVLNANFVANNTYQQMSALADTRQLSGRAGERARGKHDLRIPHKSLTAPSPVAHV